MRTRNKRTRREKREREREGRKRRKDTSKAEMTHKASDTDGEIFFNTHTQHKDNPLISI